MRPQFVQRSVTWDRGGGGWSPGVRWMLPEHDGQLSGDPFRSLAIRCNACAGLYVAGRGFLIAFLLGAAGARNEHETNRAHEK